MLQSDTYNTTGVKYQDDINKNNRNSNNDNKNDDDSILITTKILHEQQQSIDTNKQHLILHDLQSIKNNTYTKSADLLSQNSKSPKSTVATQDIQHGTTDNTTTATMAQVLRWEHLSSPVVDQGPLFLSCSTIDTKTRQLIGVASLEKNRFCELVRFDMGTCRWTGCTRTRHFRPPKRIGSASVFARSHILIFGGYELSNQIELSNNHRNNQLNRIHNRNNSPNISNQIGMNNLTTTSTLNLLTDSGSKINHSNGIYTKTNNEGAQIVGNSIQKGSRLKLFGYPLWWFHRSASSPPLSVSPTYGTKSFTSSSSCENGEFVPINQGQQQYGSNIFTGLFQDYPFQPFLGEALGDFHGYDSTRGEWSVIISRDRTPIFAATEPATSVPAANCETMLWRRTPIESQHQLPITTSTTTTHGVRNRPASLASGNVIGDPIPEPRAFHTLVKCGNALYLFGGERTISSAVTQQRFPNSQQQRNSLPLRTDNHSNVDSHYIQYFNDLWCCGLRDLRWTLVSSPQQQVMNVLLGAKQQQSLFNDIATTTPFTVPLSTNFREQELRQLDFRRMTTSTMATATDQNQLQGLDTMSIRCTAKEETDHNWRNRFAGFELNDTTRHIASTPNDFLQYRYSSIIMQNRLAELQQQQRLSEATMMTTTPLTTSYINCTTAHTPTIASTSLLVPTKTTIATMLENSQQFYPAPRSGHSASVYQRLMYIYGGQNSSAQVIYDDLWVFDIRQRTSYTSCWTPLCTTGSSPGERCGHTAVVVGHGICIYGGLTLADVNAYEKSYSSHTGSFTKPSTFNFADNNAIYFLDFDTLVWSELQVIGDPPIDSRYFGRLQGFYWDGCLWLGGATGRESFDGFEFYRLDMTDMLTTLGATTSLCRTTTIASTPSGSRHFRNTSHTGDEFRIATGSKPSFHLTHQSQQSLRTALLDPNLTGRLAGLSRQPPHHLITNESTTSASDTSRPASTAIKTIANHSNSNEDVSERQSSADQPRSTPTPSLLDHFNDFVRSPPLSPTRLQHVSGPREMEAYRTLMPQGPWQYNHSLTTGATGTTDSSDSTTDPREPTTSFALNEQMSWISPAAFSTIKAATQKILEDRINSTGLVNTQEVAVTMQNELEKSSGDHSGEFTVYTRSRTLPSLTHSHPKQPNNTSVGGSKQHQQSERVVLDMACVNRLQQDAAVVREENAMLREAILLLIPYLNIQDLSGTLNAAQIIRNSFQNRPFANTVSQESSTDQTTQPAPSSSGSHWIVDAMLQAAQRSSLGSPTPLHLSPQAPQLNLTTSATSAMTQMPLQMNFTPSPIWEYTNPFFPVSHHHQYVGHSGHSPCHHRPFFIDHRLHSTASATVPAPPPPPMSTLPSLSSSDKPFCYGIGGGWSATNQSATNNSTSLQH